MAVKLIALDLDGTLLTSQKTLSPANRAALERAAAQGVHVVPATGRFYAAMPQPVRDLPFVRYAIAVNGAQLYDAGEDKVLHRAEIPPETAQRAFRYLETLPGIYDCYVDDWGYMEASLYARVDEFVQNPHVAKMIRELRQPVEDVKGYLQGRPVQKIQIFFRDMERRALELERIPALFPELAVSSAIENNIELNDRSATKGDALQALCDRLGLRPEETMALGDGSNDLSMIRAAGIGVAMGNACPELQEAADWVTLTNDEDGVARAVERFILKGENEICR